MRALPLLALSPLLLLAGCGGGDGGGGAVGCAAVYGIEPVAAFAGHYSAAFTPQGASAATRTYDLTVAADGTVTGTVHAGDTVQAVGGFSRAGNVISGCDTSQMALSVTSPESFVAGESLNASRKRQDTLAGSYPATVISEAAQATGTIVVAVATSG